MRVLDWLMTTAEKVPMELGSTIQEHEEAQLMVLDNPIQKEQEVELGQLINIPIET